MSTAHAAGQRKTPWLEAFTAGGRKRPDLPGAALGVGQEELDGQAGGLGHLSAGVAGGAHGMLGQNAAVGDLKPTSPLKV